jgi:membrane protein implicated in regulation of membrane protease activity
VFFMRRYAAPDMHSTDEPDLNSRAAQYIGREVLVEEAIAGGRGKVRVGDTLWSAQGPDAPKGARVKVTGTSGTVLIVEPATA